MGLEPALACIILAAVFAAFSVYLFYKVNYAEYVYIFVSLSFTGKLSEKRRNEFLRTCFKNDLYKKIRIAENVSASMPFVLFLLYRQLYIPAILLLVLSVLLALIYLSTSFSLTLPTPFSKKPFEFAAGFRNTFYLFPFAYILTGIAVSADNFNLGVFSMFLVFAIAMSYYAKIENEFYIWSYKLTASKFLFEKMKTALLYSSFLVLPAAAILAIYFNGDTGRLLLFLLTGYLYLICMITAKYFSYPDEMGLIQGFLMALSLYFPLLLFVLIPFFFIRSANKLKILPA